MSRLPRHRERIRINEDWRFQREDTQAAGDALGYLRNPAVKAAVIASASASGLSPEQARLGAEHPFTQRACDDRAWRKLDLPHDWGVEGPFDIKLPGNTGKLPWAGIGWYRKTFALPASDAKRRLYLDVDGAMAYAMVWCNGVFVGGWPYGYASFRLDLTPHAIPGAENTLAIRLDNPEKSSRWYPGSGLYRNVWLVKTDSIHLANGGVTITTPVVTESRAEVAARVAVENHTAAEARLSIQTELFLGDDRVAAMPPAPLVVPPGGTGACVASVPLERPQRWSPETPACYRAVTTVLSEGAVIDAQETVFGVRTIQFTPDNGFLLNGVRVPIKGVCNHHDLGALGAAFNVRAAERQLEILKDMGANALRTSHNMPAPELLDLCDRMGFLVMVESFDAWRVAKTPNDYARLFDDWHERDLRALIRRDRNHPSVFMWCIGNEILEFGDAAAGPARAAQLTAIAHDEDPTRPTVVGSNSAESSYNGVQRGVDVMGQNYEMGGYARFRVENPDIPLVGSETASAVSTRGEYIFQTPEVAAAQRAMDIQKARDRGLPEPAPFDPATFNPVSDHKGHGQANFQMSSYDLYAPPWGRTPDDEFRAQAQNPHVAGEFVWTGFDYLGEPTPYNDDRTNLLNFHDAAGKAEMERQLKELGRLPIPSRSSYFGIVDLAGFKKDRFFLYQSHWRPDHPMVHILPHWTWPERVGLVTPVHVYTSGDEAELFLNGVSLGRRKKEPGHYRLRWNEVVYQPGELTVVAYKRGREWARTAMKTAGAPAQLNAAADHEIIANDGRDLSFVTVRVADDAGTMVPRASHTIHFDVERPGEIVAVDNGDPTSFEPFQARQRKAFNGMALVIVRAARGQAGTFTLTATSEGLRPAAIRIGIAHS